MKRNQMKTILMVAAVFDMVYVGIAAAEDIGTRIQRMWKKKQKAALPDTDEDVVDDLDYEWLDAEEEKYDDDDAEGMVM